jgi:hypothetical protein
MPSTKDFVYKDKGKGHLRTGHKGLEEQRYTSTFSLTSVLDEVGG